MRYCIIRKMLDAEDYFQEISAILSLVWRVIIVTFMKKSVDITSYMFLGRLGDTYMAAAGLANVTANVIGNSIILGLGGPISTICSQAHGAKNFKVLNETLQRAVMILLCTCIPLSLTWLCSFPIMIVLGQSEPIALLASKYLVYLIPGLFSFSYTISLQGWLHAQQITGPPATIGTITAIVHPLWCYLYVYYFGFGYIGSALAISTTRFLDGVFLTIYIVCSGHLKVTGFHLSFKASFSQWWEYLLLGAPNILMTSQWWAEEVIIFLSGTYSHPSRDLAAMSIYQYLIGICFIVPKGFSVIASSRVGYHLGRSNPISARISAWSNGFLSFVSVVMESMLLLIFRREVGSIFIKDKNVLAVVADYLVPVLSIYVLADGIQGCLAGVMNGMGRQQLAGPVVFVCYYLFGIPCAWYLGSDIGFGLGVFGLTIGIASATWLHAALYSGIVYTTDWEVEVSRTAERVGKYSQQARGSGLSPTSEQIKWTRVNDDVDGGDSDNINFNNDIDCRIDGDDDSDDGDDEDTKKVAINEEDVDDQAASLITLGDANSMSIEMSQIYRKISVAL